MKTLLEKIAGRDDGICVYGIAPPKRAEPAALETSARQQIERVERLA